MRKIVIDENWVIFRTTSHGKLMGCAVCEKHDWDQMEAANPGHHVLVRTGIKSESEAEGMARDFNVPPVPLTSGKRPPVQKAASRSPRRKT